MKTPTAILEAIQRGARWIRENPSPPHSLPMLADEAFFYHMLINRFGAAEPGSAAQWRSTLLERLRSALALPLDLKPHTSDPRWRMELCHRADYALMLAYLRHCHAAEDPETPAYVQRIYDQIMSQRNLIFGFSFLYDHVLSWFVTHLGFPVPAEATFTESYRGLPEHIRFNLEAYYLTHLPLLDSNWFAVASLPVERYERTIAFIHKHAEAVMRQGLHDLVGEFAWCLSLCGLQSDPLFPAFIDHLLATQQAEGNWHSPAYDEREDRHATYVAVMALKLASV